MSFWSNEFDHKWILFSLENDQRKHMAHCGRCRNARYWNLCPSCPYFLVDLYAQNKQHFKISLQEIWPWCALDPSLACCGISVSPLYKWFCFLVVNDACAPVIHTGTCTPAPTTCNVQSSLILQLWTIREDLALTISPEVHPVRCRKHRWPPRRGRMWVSSMHVTPAPSLTMMVAQRPCHRRLNIHPRDYSLSFPGLASSFFKIFGSEILLLPPLLSDVKFPRVLVSIARVSLLLCSLRVQLLPLRKVNS